MQPLDPAHMQQRGAGRCRIQERQHEAIAAVKRKRAQPRRGQIIMRMMRRQRAFGRQTLRQHGGGGIIQRGTAADAQDAAALAGQRFGAAY